MKKKPEKTPEGPFSLRITGVPNPGAWAYLIGVLCDRADPLRRAFGAPSLEPLVVLREKEEDLEDIADGLKALRVLDPAAKPSISLTQPALFGEEPATRLASLERLHRGAGLVLVSAEGLEARCLAGKVYADRRLVLRRGGAAPRKELLNRLGALGYRRMDFVEGPGEYAVRGAVVDFFPWEPLKGHRVLYDGDIIETLREFDPETQAGRAEMLEEAVVTPARESTAPRSVGEVLAVRGLWIVEEGLRPPPGVKRVLSVGLSSPAGFGDLDLGAASRFPPGGGIASAARFLREWGGKGMKTLFFSMNRGEDERIQEMLEDEDAAGGVQFLVGPLRHGFESESRGLAVLTSGEVFGRSYRAPRAWKPVFSERARTRWGELKRGDFVVHDAYGVARYLGLETVMTKADPDSITAPPVRRDGTRRLGKEDPEQPGGAAAAMDCLKLEFRGRDTLFVPMAEFKEVQKYVGAAGHRPRLSSLDRRNWQTVQQRVREGVRDLARQLLKVQAKRKALPGHAFGSETHMEREFRESFPFEETADQRQAIEEVAADMEAPHPMDRVIVGDVGFGKTEVAMRAALKCVAGLKQAALLVPTTILADQHARTFRRRFAEYPIRIEMLSRFQTKAEQKKILEAAAAGAVDILIGTHRLLQGDVRFKSLGLLVIDEEHRFGVGAKEAFKQLARQVHVLTLSATPIPRTLNQCLSGLRQISLIQSAPTGRRPVATAVLPHDDAHVAKAIRDELARGGQVFYVHNRVRSLPRTAARLTALLPEARICVAHGAMRSERLEKTMWDFFKGNYDVLAASSIIESGLDIPTVNTLLIENAQDFGLSQLYQLRGRIGREKRRAYCYLYYPADRKDYRSLSEEARKRLEAMRDFADLGSGFTLAMRDLEIRGAGDLLGAKQHGFLNAVGVEFYSELLADEIARLRGRKPASAPIAPAHLDIALPAYLPKDYFPGDLERIQFYKRMLAADAEGLDALERELADLSGPLPAAVKNLFRVVRIRRMANGAGVRSLVQRGSRVEVYFHPNTEVPVEAVTRWMSAYEDRIEFVRSPEGDGLRIWIKDRSPVEWIVDFLLGFKKAR